MLRRAVVVAVLALTGSGSAIAATPQELTLTMSDGAQLACSLTLPDPPATATAGVILFHGLGGRHQDLEPLATQFLAPAGYAALACDARGHGASQGQFGLDGPRDTADTRELYDWLAARIGTQQIGALGLSLGGGAVWNALRAGVPFKAAVPIVTWTNLLGALAPQGLAKSGLVAYLAGLVPTSRWDPQLLAAAQGLTTSADLTAVAALAAARSVTAAQLRAIATPTLLVQGRRDFLFDVDQALAAYRSLGGPKALYLGDLGHLPAANPPAEQPALDAMVVKWFDRYLKGTPNGIDRTKVVLAHDPWDGKTTAYAGVPASKRVSVNLPGSTTITGAGGRVVRSVRITGGPHETFGDSTVTVRYANAKGFDHLVAVLALQGSPTPISAGGARLKGASGTARIRLLDEVVRVPAGRKLVLYLSSTSLAQSPANALYVAGAPPDASVTVGKVTLRLSVLRQAPRRRLLASVRSAPGANTGTISVSHDPMAPAGSRSTTLHVTLPQSDDPIAAIDIYAPGGYRYDLSQPPGTTIGTVDSVVFSHAAGLTLPLSGDVVVADPASFAQQSTQCTGAPASAAVWLLNLSVAGQTIRLPVYVNPTAGAEQALGAEKISVCLPPWDVPEAAAGAAQGAQMLDVRFTVNGVFTTPSAGGLLRWDALVTPYTRATGEADPAGTFEARAFVPLPVLLRLHPASVPGTSSFRLTGRVTEAGLAVPNLTVHISRGTRTSGLTQQSSTRTKANGSYTAAGRLAPHGTTTYVRVQASMPEHDFAAGCRSPAPVAVAPAGCVSAKLSGWSVQSGVRRLALPKT